ncbi:MAG: hemin receptor [Anaerolineae bacterium]|nr:hemin receptor [Anaerolineae bacterium]
MSLTPTQKALVQSSFEKVVPIADVAADLFYRRLFQLDPSLRALFRHDMTEQGRMLMQTITVAVRSLDRLDSLVPALHELGKRHVGYGVPIESYATVGEALLWTLEQGLGPDFTPEVREAWAHTYSLLAATAIEGAHELELEAAMV